MAPKQLSADYWRGRRVLVTGHTGFKGGWLSLWLTRLGAQVTGFATAPPTEINLFESARVSQHVHHIHGDVRELDAVRAAFKESRPQVVFHMAAQSLVRPSYEDPVTTFTTNVLGTVHVLDAVRSSDTVEAVVNVTSDKCYDNDGSGRALTESDRLGGHDPYSSSKACAELVAQAFGRSYFDACKEGPRLANVRAGNVIGGGDWATDRLIPDIIRAISLGRAAEIRNPDAVRPWQHVLEPLHGYLLLAEALGQKHQGAQGGWNFGPSHDVRNVRWVADRLCAHWGGEATWQSPAGALDAPYEAAYLKLDCTRAKESLGWTTHMTLDQAIQSTTEWYRHFANGEDVAQLTNQQIDAYMNAKGVCV